MITRQDEAVKFEVEFMLVFIINDSPQLALSYKTLPVIFYVKIVSLCYITTSLLMFPWLPCRVYNDNPRLFPNLNPSSMVEKPGS